MLTRTRMLFLAVTIMSLGGGVTLAVAGDEGLPTPPEPDPDDPIDYVQWYNDVYDIKASDNAALIYEQAYALVSDSNLDWKAVTQQPWSENQEVRRWLNENRRAMEIFKSGTLKPDCFMALTPPDSECRLGQSMLNVLLPGLSKHRVLVRAWIAEGYLAAASGDEARLIENALIGLRSGHHLDRSPMLIEGLVGIACNSLSYTAILNGLDLSDAPAALAAQTLPVLEQNDRPIPDLRKSILTERVFFLDVAQRLYVPDKETGQLTLLNTKSCPEDESSESMFGLGFWGRWAQFAIGYERTIAEANVLYDLLDECVRLPFPEAKVKAEEFDNGVEKTANPLVRMFSPSLFRAQELRERCETLRQATHLTLRIFTYQNEHEQFPESLDDLDLDMLPIDMYTGKPLAYRKTADSFLLYSLGVDANDNHGQHDDHWGEDHGGDYVFWPRPDLP